jgi:hypothetical protein
MNVITALAVPFALALIVGVPLMPPPVVSDGRGSAAELRACKSRRPHRLVQRREDATGSWMNNDGNGRPTRRFSSRSSAGTSACRSPSRPRREEGGQQIGDLGILPDYGSSPSSLTWSRRTRPPTRPGCKPGDRSSRSTASPYAAASRSGSYITSHPSGRSRSPSAAAGRRSSRRGRDAQARRQALGFGPGNEYADESRRRGRRRRAYASATTSRCCA